MIALSDVDLNKADNYESYIRGATNTALESEKGQNPWVEGWRAGLRGALARERRDHAAYWLGRLHAAGDYPRAADLDEE